MRDIGQTYEERAALMIREAGLELIARNFNTRMGEIDLIAQSGNTLVFIEVRARSNTRFSSAAGSVDRRKQARLIRTAQYYLKKHPARAHCACRFDVIAFEPPQSTAEQPVRWIQGAFTA